MKASLIVGIVKNHMRLCDIDNCKCKEILFDGEECALQVDSISDNENRKNSSSHVNQQEIEKTVCEILNTTLKNIKQRENVEQVFILQAYINCMILNKIFLALHNLMTAEEYELSYVQKKSIELKMIEEEKRNSSSLKLNFGNIVKFNKKYIAFNNLISETTFLYCKYWYEFLEPRPELNELVKFGYEISKNCQLIESILRQLIAIDPNSLKGMILYALFQKTVMEDDFGAYETYMIIKRQEESQHLLKKHWEESEFKYGLDINPAVIILSGGKQTIGTIIDANYEIQQILGYHKDELIGESVSSMMPEVIGAHHNAYIESYFENHEESNISEIIERLVFAQHSKGYIVPCSKLVRLIPNLENDIQFIGFLTQSKDLSVINCDDTEIRNKDLLVLLLDEKMHILGFNMNVVKLCCGNDVETNFKKYFENDQKVSLKAIYPELFSAENKKLFKDTEGITMTLNLELLKKRLSSEILDNYDDVEETSHPSNGKKNNIETLEHTSVNIKFNEFKHPTKLGNHIICTILAFDYEEINSLKGKEDEKNNKTGQQVNVDNNSNLIYIS